MQIDNKFTVSVPIEQAWRVLTDLEGIAPCMPGAQLTGVDGDVYRGKVKIKVGPVTSEYAGTARFSEKDDADHHAVIDAKGRDARGAGNASALITAQLTPDGPQTVVSVSTDLKISGRIAQFGSGMIKEVSTKLLGQFVDNLEARIGAGSDEAAPSGEGTAAPAESGQPTSGSAPGGSGSAAAGSSGGTAAGEAQAGTQAQAGPAAGQQAAARPAPAASAQAAEPAALNLMSIAGSSVYKRAIPLVIALVVIIGLIIYFAVR